MPREANPPEPGRPTVRGENIRGLADVVPAAHTGCPGSCPSWLARGYRPVERPGRERLRPMSAPYRTGQGTSGRPPGQCGCGPTTGAGPLPGTVGRRVHTFVQRFHVQTGSHER